ncbi:MAG: peroxiredoxin-like family protein [Steroidobacteraceae bacterium]|jgi:peroxiredoxin
MMKFCSLSIGLLGILAAVPALAGFPDSPQQVQPLSVGARAPIFAARTMEGALRTFAPDSYKKPTVVLFYRGGWCPYCNAQLSDLHLVEPRLRESGFEIVFLSTDRPELLYSSLKATDIHYTLLSDSQLEAAKAFHVAYHVDDATLAKMREYGVDLEATTGTKQHELPVPSVFIIDTSGTIRFVYSNPDYKIRLGADALWAAARPLATVK